MYTVCSLLCLVRPAVVREVFFSTGCHGNEAVVWADVSMVMLPHRSDELILYKHCSAEGRAAAYCSG
jgi:hypothetical protein